MFLIHFYDHNQRVFDYRDFSLQVPLKLLLFFGEKERWYGVLGGNFVVHLYGRGEYVYQTYFIIQDNGQFVEISEEGEKGVLILNQLDNDLLLGLGANINKVKVELLVTFGKRNLESAGLAFNDLRFALHLDYRLFQR